MSGVWHFAELWSGRRRIWNMCDCPLTLAYHVFTDVRNAIYCMITKHIPYIIIKSELYSYNNNDDST